MPAPLTVILPTLNVAQTLGPTLASLYQGVDDGLIGELVFADGGSTDDTAALANDVGARLVACAVGRGTQLAAAAQTVKTPWMLFLHADTVLSADWPWAVRHHITTSQKAAHFRLAFDSHSRGAKCTAGWANLRSNLFGLPYGDQGLLISTALYRSVGGYPEIPLMEDVALVRKLRGHLVELPVTATTSAEKYEREGYITRGGKNLLTLTKYLLGVSPEALAKKY